MPISRVSDRDPSTWIIFCYFSRQLEGIWVKVELELGPRDAGIAGGSFTAILLLTRVDFIYLTIQKGRIDGVSSHLQNLLKYLQNWEARLRTQHESSTSGTGTQLVEPKPAVSQVFIIRKLDRDQTESSNPCSLIPLSGSYPQIPLLSPRKKNFPYSGGNCSWFCFCFS